MQHEKTKAHTLSLPALELCVTCEPSDPNAERINLEVDSEKYTYSRTLQTSPFSKTNYRDLYRWNGFPSVIKSDGSPWLNANLYLLENAESVDTRELRTLESKALSLTAFRRFLDELGLDYLSTPKRKPQRPTYAFRDWLQDKIDLGELSENTARGRISHIKGFYTWLIYEGIYPLPKPNYLWTAKELTIFFTDDKGFARGKKTQTSDLKIKAIRSTHAIHEAVNDDRELLPTIDDGGKLKPLLANEQEALVDTLFEIENTHWTLIFLLALFTGARKQTILTLQVRHVSTNLSDEFDHVRLPVGPGTEIDTKGNKKSTILISKWLYERLRTYAYSQIAIERRIKNGDDSQEQYLFLSSHGNPFYESKAKARRFDAKAKGSAKPRGTSLNQFMSETLIPIMRNKLDRPNFRFQFHDLRATCGMNALEEQLIKVNRKETTLTEALRFVQRLLDHANLSTTEGYLTYRNDYEELRNLQKKFEGHLKNITEKAMNGFYAK